MLAGHLVQFWHVRGADEDGVGGVLELHLDAHLRVAHHQLGGGVRRRQGQQGRQARRPAPEDAFMSSEVFLR